MTTRCTSFPLDQVGQWQTTINPFTGIEQTFRVVIDAGIFMVERKPEFEIVENPFLPGTYTETYKCQ